MQSFFVAVRLERVQEPPADGHTKFWRKGRSRKGREQGQPGFEFGLSFFVELLQLLGQAAGLFIIVGLSTKGKGKTEEE